MLNGVPTLADLQGWLQEARTAHHALTTGKQFRVFVDQNGERIEYTATSAARLATYIRDLEQQIADMQAGVTPRRAPLRFWFA